MVLLFSLRQSLHLKLGIFQKQTYPSKAYFEQALRPPSILNSQLLLLRSLHQHKHSLVSKRIRQFRGSKIGQVQRVYQEPNNRIRVQTIQTHNGNPSSILQHQGCAFRFWWFSHFFAASFFHFSILVFRETNE